MGCRKYGIKDSLHSLQSTACASYWLNPTRHQRTWKPGVGEAWDLAAFLRGQSLWTWSRTEKGGEWV